MEEHNPYAAPVASVEPRTDVAAGAGGPLFRVAGIGLATFVGTTLAGGVVLAMNYRAMGQPGRAWPAVLVSLAVTAAILVLAWVLPESVPGVVFTLPPLFAMIEVARRQQGAAIQARIAAGLPMRSNWQAVGIALLVLFGILALFSLALVAYLASSGLTWDEFMQA